MIRLAILRTPGALGFLLFLSPLLYTFADRATIERDAGSFIAWRLQTELAQAIDATTASAESKLGALLNDFADSQLAKAKHQLKEDLPGLVADRIAELRNLDCECRLAWETAIREGLTLQLESFEQLKASVVNFTNAKYMQIVENLTLDLRIFLAVNAAAFLFLLLLSFNKPQAAIHLFVPAMLLGISTLICSYFYLLKQDWFYTILYNDYTGLGYLAYVLVVFGVLCDIALNKARVTTKIINGIGSAVGSMPAVAPC